MRRNLSIPLISPRTLLVGALLLLTAALAPLGAQDRPGDGIIDDSSAAPLRALFGGQFYYAQPLGEFADYIQRGWGGDVSATALVGPSGAFGIRFEGGLMNYGHSRTPVCLYDCRFDADLTTSNNIAFLQIGPQLVTPTGAVRPYASGTVGWTWMWTTSSLEGVWDGATYDSNTDFSDNTFSWGGSAGVLVPLTGAGRTPVSLDLGLRYLNNGRLRYLREGDIVERPGGGTPFYNVQQSDVNLLTYHIGFSVGLR
jgi:hypothetical protein